MLPNKHAKHHFTTIQISSLNRCLVAVFPLRFIPITFSLGVNGEQMKLFTLKLQGIFSNFLNNTVTLSLCWNLEKFSFIFWGETKLKQKNASRMDGVLIKEKHQINVLINLLVSPLVPIAQCLSPSPFQMLDSDEILIKFLLFSSLFHVFKILSTFFIGSSWLCAMCIDTNSISTTEMF